MACAVPCWNGRRPLGDGLVGDHRVGGLTGSVDLGGVRHPQDPQVTVVGAGGIGVDRHVGGQVGAPTGHVDAGQGEDRVVVLRPLHREVVRGLLGGAVGAADRVVRHLPQTGLQIPVVGIGHVVARQDAALHLEHVLRVAQVLPQVRGDLALRQHRSRERLLPGLQDRVVLVPLVELDAAVVGVDDGLDRVADVVDVRIGLGHHVGALGRRLRVGGDRVQADPLRVRVGVRGRVAVHDPDDASVHDRGIRVAVHLEPRCGLLHPLPGGPVVDDLGLGVHPVRQQDVDVAELRRVEQSVPQAADVHPTLALVRVRRRVAAVAATGGVQLDRRAARGGADDGVAGLDLTEVDPRLVLVDLALRRDVPDDPLGLATGLALVAVRRDHAVAVGVDGAQVVPVLALDAGDVHLPHRHHGVGLGAVDGVAVHVQGVGELVVATDLLELLVRGADH